MGRCIYFGLCKCVGACVCVCVHACVRVCACYAFESAYVDYDAHMSFTAMEIQINVFFMYTRQVTIHSIEMKVVVCFAAICFLALAMAREEDTDWPPAPKPTQKDDSPAARQVRAPKGVWLFYLHCEKSHIEVLFYYI